MYFNRKNAEQKNWRMIKKGKHFLFGCSLVFAVGAALVAPSVKADAVDAKPEASSTAEGVKPAAAEENPTYAAPAVEVAPAAVAEEKVKTTQNSKEEPVVTTEKAKEADSIQAPEVTVVYNPEALTDEEKAKVVAAVKAANSKATDVQVQADGSVVITFADGSTASLSAAQTIKDGSKVAKPRRARAAVAAPVITSNLDGKGSSATDVTVQAPAGSTVKLYNSDGVVIGQAVANAQGVAIVTPTNSLPVGEITATATPAGESESPKSAPVTATRAEKPEVDGGVSRGNDSHNTQLLVTRSHITVYPGETVKIGVTAVSKALENFWVPNNPEGVKGLKPTGVYLKTAGTETYTRRDNGYGGTVAWDQPAGDTVVTFAVRSKNNALVKRDLRVTVLELTKKLDAVPGEKVEVSDLKNISEDEKNKIIEATKKANASFPPGTLYNVDQRGNLVITYPDKSTDKITAAYLVTPAAREADKYTPTAKEQTVKIGDAPKAEDSIANFKDLPSGTTAKFKEPVDTKTPGEKTPVVVVTYPDKSTDEVPVKVTVKDPRSDADKNEPKAKEQTVKIGDAPKAEDSIANFKDLPSGTTAKFKEPVDTTTPGEKTPVVVVIYPDGSKDEVPVKVTVKDPRSDADKNEPKAKEQTVKIGDAPKAEDSIANFKDLPSGTTAKFKEPVDTKTPGEKTPVVVVTYPDKSTDEVPVKVTVKDPRSDADKNEPKAKDQTVKVGDAPKAEDSIANFKDLPSGTTAKFKEPVDTTTPGEKTPVVVVTYPDGSKDEVPVKVTVKDPRSDADKNEPKAKEQTVKIGDAPKAEDSIANFKDLPSGTTAKFKEPVDTTTPGEKTPVVVVIYPDGSKDEVPVKVTVKDPRSDADKNEPKAKDQTVKVGDAPKAEDSIANFKDLPSGTTAKFKEPVDTTTPGEKTPVVVVTYPDGSKDEVPVKVTVKDPRSDADKNEPKAKEQTVKIGDAPKAEDSIANFKDLPSGTTAKFKEPVDTTTPGEKTPVVVVIYPDGSKDEVPVKVTVKDPRSDADKNEPKAKEQTVKVGDAPKAEDSIANFKDLPSGTTAKFKEPVDTTTPGEKTPVVVVTYPDGSKDEVPVKVTVKDPRSDADKNEPKAKEQTVKIGDAPKAEDSIANFKDLPSGTTAKFKEPVDTKTPGEKTPVVVVTYPDKSTDEVPVKVTVKDPRSDADKNEPKAKDQTVKVGDAPKAEDSIANFKDLPSGTTAKFKEPVDTTTPGEKTPVVVVTYPDGSKDEVPVKVTVKDPRSDADKNEPKAKDQTVKIGDAPKAEDSIANFKDLPSGTTAKFKEPVDTTTPGDKTLVVVVTYPDGSKDEVLVKVTVKDPRSDADKNEPKAKEQTVKIGDAPKAEDSIANFKDLPSGTTAKFKEPVDTTTPGEKTPVVVVTYPDGSKDEVPVKVTVKDPRSDADKNEPKAKDQTVKVGDAPKAEDSIANFKDLPSGTTAKFKEPVDTTTPGEKTPVVVVTYPDGSKDEVPVKVTVKDPRSDADKNEPKAKEQTVKIGDAPKAEDSIANFKDLPSGTTAKFKEPVDTTTPGEKTPVVVVIYPDGSKDEVPVKVTVKDPRSDADKNEPKAKEQTVKIGDAPKAEDSIANFKDLPSGTTAKFKEPVDTKTPGEKTPVVVVTYPDKSTDEVPVKVTVKDPRSDADKNEPKAKDQTVKVGDAPKAEDSIANFKDLPSGTTAKFKEPVDTTTPGEKTPVVVVTYPDGSKDEVPVKVTVKDPRSDADKNEPKAKEQTVKIGDAPKAEDSIANFKDLPSGTTAKFKEPVDTTTPGEKTPVVVVIYPDGSKDEVPVKVTVKDPRSDADKNEPKAKEQTVKVGDAPKAEDSIANFKDLPSGTTAKFKEPVDTTTPGEKTPVVVVIYPDGSKDEVPVKVTVKDPRSDADKNEPKAKEQTVKIGDAPKAEDSIANFKDLPSGTTAKFKEPVDTKTPGEKTPVVVVTYPDGSKDEVPVKVTVKDPRSDADKNEPKAKDQTVKIGDAPKAEDSIANFKDLPSGTTAKFKEPVDTTTPGDKTLVVVVTYPDGSKDEVLVKVTVKDPRSDADKNEPKAKEQTVKIGDAPKAEDSIANFKDLPSGTTAKFKEPVDTTTPGEKTPVVVVTYPDGSKDEVPVKVTVKDPRSDADKNEPKAKDQTVKVGDAPKAEDSIANFKDLPSGTTAKFKEPVDTTTPGEKTPVVVVTYPDGSKDEVPVKVTVKDPRSDADKNEPKAKEQTVKIGDAPKAEDSIANFKDLPSGTTAKFKEPVDTTTPGEKTPVVVVIYPDGSKDEVPVKVTVKDPRSDADKNEPKAKEQTVKIGDAPKAEDSIANFKDLPSGTTAKFKEPVDTKTPGEKTPVVVVTYPDKSTDEVPVKVTVKDPRSDADKNEPKAKDQTVKVGDAPKAEDSIANFKDLPSGTTAKFKEPVDTTTPGEKTPVVVVTYPDGSKDEVPVKVTVKDPRSDADKNEPKAKEQTVKIGDAPKAEDSIANFKDLPSGTTAKFKEPVDTTTPGEKTPVVVVIYPDGSKDEVPVKVTVKDPRSDADKNEPKAKEQTVKVGDAPKAEDSIANFKDLPSGTTAKFKEPVDTTTPGEKTPVVVVIYPDGSKDEVPVKVTVKDPRSDADKNEPKAKEQTVKIGDAPKAEDSIANFKDLPSGTTAKFKEPVDTKTPGEKTPVVVVTYPDKSTDEVPVKVTVKDPRSDADKNEPKAKDQTVKVGDAPKAEDSIANFKDLPSGTTAKFKEPVDTTTPGEKTPVVVVTYPDGSKDEVPVKVTVKDPRSDADKNEPKAKDQTVKIGDAPKAEDSIANFKDLPSGTTAKFKEPVDTTTPGDKTLVVVVTYPDGSKDEVLVKVTVKDPRSDADKNEPKAKEQTVKIGDAPKAEDSIANFKDLPSGTTAKFKEPVDTTTPGEKTPVVVVTYPDGSKDEVPVKVTVKDPRSDADKNEPKAKEQTVKIGDAPKAEDSIANFKDLPSGTTAKFKEPVDTTTPGEKTPVVVVTYPDGSKDEVPVKVTVKDPRSDADKNEPKVATKDPAITPVVNPSTKKAGAKELPNTGTEKSNASLGLVLLAAVTGGLLFAKKRKEEE